MGTWRVRGGARQKLASNNIELISGYFLNIQ
jgi:hypothetical protein